MTLDFDIKHSSLVCPAKQRVKVLIGGS